MKHQFGLVFCFFLIFHILVLIAADKLRDLGMASDHTTRMSNYIDIFFSLLGDWSFGLKTAKYHKPESNQLLVVCFLSL